jgi:prepilin-type N-terminal cleavage/methylation domain-containing protein
MKRLKQLQNRGFTIIELLIATLIFSIVLLVMTVGVVQVGRAFYKAYISSKTQEAARSLADEIGQAIQFSGGTVIPLTPSGTVEGICINSTVYTYKQHEVLGDATGLHKFIARSPVTPCPSSVDPTIVNKSLSTTLPTTDRELLGKNMRLAYFKVTPVPNSSGSLWNIKIRVVYGDDDKDLLISPTHPTSTTPWIYDDVICKTTTGSQFCATADISTVVQKRLISVGDNNEKNI